MSNRAGRGRATRLHRHAYFDRRRHKRLAAFRDLLSSAALKHITVETLAAPPTPNLAAPASHKPAYDLFEHVKQRGFDEVHSLDRYGLIYYAAQAKQLGLYLLQTVFVAHVVGGALFRAEAEDSLLSTIEPLVDDLLERGSLERADVIYVHDRKAWHWYADKLQLRPESRVYDLAPAQPMRPTAKAAPADPGTPLALIYYGSLGAADGLPLFCDVVGRALPQLQQPIEVCFIGSPQAIGGMDAVSYIRLRAAKWGVPITIKRDLSLEDELAYIQTLGGVVVSNTLRRESLRSRLVASAGLPVLRIDRANDLRQAHEDGTYPAIPHRVAKALVEMLANTEKNKNKTKNRRGSFHPSVGGVNAGPSDHKPSSAGAGAGRAVAC